MLLAVLDYIRKHKTVSQDDLSRIFNIDPTALEAILEIGVNKGIVHCLRQTTACKTGCRKSCHVKIPVFYEYAQRVSAPS